MRSQKYVQGGLDLMSSLGIDIPDGSIVLNAGDAFVDEHLLSAEEGVSQVSGSLDPDSVVSIRVSMFKLGST